MTPPTMEHSQNAARVAQAITGEITAYVAEHRAAIHGWFEQLHSNPELSGNEHATTALLIDVLRAHGLDPVPFAGTGLYVDIGPAPHRIAFRGDIDALPIVEATGLPYASTNGAMHACGHDAHTTIVLGFACALARLVDRGELPVGVRVIFQPAEEVMVGGAVDVIAEGGLAGVEHIFAVHCEPGLQVGTIGVREGAITYASDTMDIEMRGTGGHTARPHLTTDLVYAASHVVTSLPGIVSRRVDPRSGTIVVFGAIHAGNAGNAIPDHAELKGTVRTGDVAVWRASKSMITEAIDHLLTPLGVDYQLNYRIGVPPVVNDPWCTQLAAEAFSGTVVAAPQSSGGEDFAWYLQEVPGTLIRLGCWSGEGEAGGLHKANLVVAPETVDWGIRLYGEILGSYIEKCPVELE